MMMDKNCYMGGDTISCIKWSREPRIRCRLCKNEMQVFCIGRECDNLIYHHKNGNCPNCETRDDWYYRLNSPMFNAKDGAYLFYQRNKLISKKSGFDTKKFEILYHDEIYGVLKKIIIAGSKKEAIEFFKDYFNLPLNREIDECVKV